jgi:putative ABC transport system permease protein
MNTLVQDIRYALRMLRRSPGFTVVAVLTLALGIGATVAIFSAINGVLLRPLPYPDANRIAIVWLSGPEIERDVATYPMFQAWRAEAPSFESMAGFSPTRNAFTGDGAEAEEVGGARVSGDFFGVLQTRPYLGQTIDEVHTAAGSHQVVVLSHALWSRRFGSDPGVLGRTVLISDEPREVIAVMPPEFSFPDGADFWLPLAPENASWEQLLATEQSLWLSVVGRLRPGVSHGRASAEISGITGRVLAELDNPATTGMTAFTEPLHATIVGDIRAPLLILFAAVGMVLLIACANVANLLLARGAGRGRELAVRSALGASGARVTRQVLTESMVLAAVGGLGGLLVAIGGTSLLVSLGPAELPRLDDVHVDGSVLSFAALVILLTGILFGLAPALQARVTVIATAMQDAARGSSGRAMSRVRPLIVIGQVALALMLLVGAGLLLRSFAAIQSVDAGFQTERVLSFRVSPGASGYPEQAQVRELYDQLFARIGAIPAVESVSATTTLLLPRYPSMGMVAIEGQAPIAESESTVSVTSDFVHPDFFRTVGMPIVRGRGFEASDGVDAVPVVLVNETFVRRFLPGEDPVGRRFTRGDPENEDAFWVTIVGVVADARREGLTAPVRPAGFRPTSQAIPRSLEVVLRTTGNPMAVAPEVRSIVRDLDPNLPVVQMRTVREAVAETVAAQRFVLMLLLAFAGLAVMLAAIGIYGVLSYLVEQRTRELGVRMALGAEPQAVQVLVLRQAAAHVLPGIVIGAAGALALSRLLAAELHGVTPTDPLTFAAVAALLFLVALVASLLPARRAARMDPMIALRAE